MYDFVVAPRVGAWIEIFFLAEYYLLHGSLPAWERGLKSSSRPRETGAISRSPRGSVD